MSFEKLLKLNNSQVSTVWQLDYRGSDDVLQGLLAGCQGCCQEVFDILNIINDSVLLWISVLALNGHCYYDPVL